MKILNAVKRPPPPRNTFCHKLGELSVEVKGLFLKTHLLEKLDVKLPLYQILKLERENDIFVTRIARLCLHGLIFMFSFTFFCLAV